MNSTIKEKVFDYITEEGEIRSCDKIKEEACNQQPGNYLKFVVNGACSKLAETLISPGITLPWIISALGGQAFLTGVPVPLKNIGSLLPQLVISGKIRAKKIRKNYWALASLVQAGCMGASAGLVLINSSWVSWIILFLFLIFSIASGVASVAFKDVSGKTIDKGLRGQMLGARATIGGALSLGAGVILHMLIAGSQDVRVYAMLFGISSILWIGAAYFFYAIKEKPGATEGGRNPINEFKSGLGILKRDDNFRRFIITRALLMSIPLATPFYVILSKEYTDNTISNLGLLVILAGVANVVSSPIWGKFADRSSRKMMAVVAILGILTGVYSLVYPLFNFDQYEIYLFAPVILFNNIAHAGARLSRKTYLVDMAPEDERPTYVSLSNTLIGLFTVLAATFGFISSIFSLQAQIAFFMIMMVAAIGFAYGLKEV